MHFVTTLLQIAAVYSLALISPGPNFLMITQLSLSGKRALGVASAVGVGMGSTLWATLAMLGFATVLQRIDWLYNGVRIGGALYLAWLGFKLLRSGARRDPAAVAHVVIAPLPDARPETAAAAPQAASALAPAASTASPDTGAGSGPNATAPTERHPYLRACRMGFLTCLTSPKSCVFWTSVFAAMLPARPPLWFFGATLVTVATMSFGWHCSLAFLFADDRTQRGYRRLRRPIDAFCGMALVGLGVKLMADR
jgi:threonine efflux protein